MTKQDLRQISDLFDDKWVKEFQKRIENSLERHLTPIKGEIEKIKSTLTKMEEHVEGLNKDINKLMEIKNLKH